MANSAQLRRHARKSLRGKWKTAILITFGASIISFLGSIIMVDFNWSTYLGPHIMNLSFVQQQEIGEIDWMPTILILATFVVSQVLWLGVNHFNIQINRGQEANFTLLFSRMNIWLKSIGQILMISLFVIGWYLVFLAPFLLLVYVFRYTPYFLLAVGPIGLLCGLVVVLLRYSMSTYLMADDPDMGIMESIRESKRMMTGQKGRFFKLMLSFLGWMVLTFGIQFVVWHVSYLVAIIVGFCCSLVYQTYMNASIAAFYLDLKGELNLKR